jgi:hypothetical protein
LTVVQRRVLPTAARADAATAARYYRAKRLRQQLTQELASNPQMLPF